MAQNFRSSYRTVYGCNPQHPIVACISNCLSLPNDLVSGAHKFAKGSSLDLVEIVIFPENMPNFPKKNRKNISQSISKQIQTKLRQTPARFQRF